MSKNRGVDHAVPMVTGPTSTDVERVSITRTHVGAMQKSPEWAKALDVQKTAGDWSTAADNLEANAKKVADLKKALAAALAEELVLRRRWTAAGHVCVSAVETYCDGSVDTAKSLGFDVHAKVVRPAAGVPQELMGKRGKVAGVATATWNPGDKRRHTFQVQHCTDTANQATYSAPLAVTRKTFKLAGQAPGATIYFRVRTLDPKLPEGQTDWTPWVAITVS
jgi:hypothetical protein